MKNILNIFKLPILAITLIQFYSNVYSQTIDLNQIHDLIEKSSMEINPDSAEKILMKLDSIIRLETVPDTLKAMYYHQQGNIALDRNNYQVADSLYTLAHKVYFSYNNIPTKQISILNSQGNLSSRKGEMNSAEKYFNDALNLAKKNNEKYYIGLVLYNLGHLYEEKGQYEKAIQTTIDAANTFKEINNTKRYIQANQELAMRIDNFNINKSLEILNKLKDLPEIDSFPVLKLINFANLGVIYGKMNKADSSLLYLKLALDIAEENNLKYHKTNLYGSIANSYLLKNNNKMAIEYYKKERQLLRPKQKFEIAINYLNSGMSYYKSGDYKQALKNYLKAEEISKRLNNPDFSQFVQKQKAYTLYKLKKYKLAFNTYKNASIKKDSIYNEKNAKRIEEIEIKYQTKIKQDSINLLKSNQKIAMQELTLNKSKNKLLGMGIIILFGLSGFLFYINKSRKKMNKLLLQKNEQITTLSRENSHRIKNNLSLLSSMMNMQIRRLDTPEIKDAVRESENRVRALSILEKELQAGNFDMKVNLGDYMQKIIQNIRSFYSTEENSLEINTEFDDIVLDADKAMRLGLIINELITNSIKHAFKSQGKPQIEIKLINSDVKDLHLYYMDNGSGIDTAINIETSNSIGMKLIYNMTKQLHGSLKTKNDNGAIFMFTFSDLSKSA